MEEGNQGTLAQDKQEDTRQDKSSSQELEIEDTSTTKDLSSNKKDSSDGEGQDQVQDSAVQDSAVQDSSTATDDMTELHVGEEQQEQQLQHTKEQQPQQQEQEQQKEQQERETSTPIEAIVSTPTPAPETAVASRTVVSKRKRLAQDVVGRLQDQVEDDEYNVGAWRGLIDELRQQNKLDEIRTTFERVLKVYPWSSEMWMQYIRVELDNSEFERVEQLFTRSLTTVPDVSLWTMYLGYIQRMNNVGSGDEQARSTVIRAFEFALDNVGVDFESGGLWMAFISFIKSRASPGSASWEEQQTMDLLRKTYRRATSVPMKKDDLERLWSEYNAFENNLNRATARKFLGERSPIYMKARSCSQELENMRQGLVKDTTPGRRRWTIMEVAEANKWRRWIDWEKSNVDAFEDKKHDRVKYAYKQALMTLRFFPELWFEAATYSLAKGDNEEGADLLHLGTEANPASFLVSLRLAQYYELEVRYDDMHSVFAKLIATHKKERQLIEEQQQQQLAEASSPGDDGEQAKKGAQLEARLHTTDKAITSAYIQYMRAVKRSQGIKEARLVFKDGRAFPHSTYELYVDAALMEHRGKQSKVAGKIFEIGLKKFGDDPQFVEKYFDFLVSIDDETNARALFEKSIIRMDATKARPLFRHFLQHEATYGDIQALTKLEQRYTEIYKGETELELFCDRYKEGGFDPIAVADFGGLAEKTSKENGSNTEGGSQTIKRLRQVSPDSTIPESIMSLLASLPARAYYGDGHVFDANEVVKIITSVNV